MLKVLISANRRELGNHARDAGGCCCILDPVVAARCLSDQILPGLADSRLCSSKGFPSARSCLCLNFNSHRVMRMNCEADIVSSCGIPRRIHPASSADEVGATVKLNAVSLRRYASIAQRNSLSDLNSLCLIDIGHDLSRRSSRNAGEQHDHSQQERKHFLHDKVLSVCMHIPVTAFS